MKFIKRFVCKVCWFVMKGLYYVFGAYVTGSLLGVVVKLVSAVFDHDFKFDSDMILIIIIGVVALPLCIGCMILAEKLKDIYDSIDRSSSSYSSSYSSSHSSSSGSDKIWGMDRAEWNKLNDDLDAVQSAMGSGWGKDL